MLTLFRAASEKEERRCETPGHWNHCGALTDPARHRSVLVHVTARFISAFTNAFCWRLRDPRGGDF